MSQTLAIIYLSIIAFGAGFILIAPFIGMAIDKVRDLLRK